MTMAMLTAMMMLISMMVMIVMPGSCSDNNIVSYLNHRQDFSDIGLTSRARLNAILVRMMTKKKFMKSVMQYIYIAPHA